MKTSHAFLLIGAALAWAGSARAQAVPDAGAERACSEARQDARDDRFIPEYRVAIEQGGADAGAVEGQREDAAKTAFGSRIAGRRAGTAHVPAMGLLS